MSPRCTESSLFQFPLFPFPKKHIWVSFSNGILRPQSWHSFLTFNADPRNDFCPLIGYSDTFGWERQKRLLHLASLPKNVLLFFVLILEDKILSMILRRVSFQIHLTTGLCHAGPLLHWGVMPRELLCSWMNCHPGDLCTWSHTSLNHLQGRFTYGLLCTIFDKLNCISPSMLCLSIK